jgi:DHA2 family multidrug resistance protein
VSTVSLASIPRHRLSDATGMNSLMRQIGGSVGLAVFATLLSRYGVQAADGLRAHLTPDRLEVIARLGAGQAAAAAHGIMPAVGAHLALGQLAGVVARESTVMAFHKLFIIGALLFAAVMPLMFFLRRPKLETEYAPGEAPHVEV